jgi:hypothetical protein
VKTTVLRVGGFVLCVSLMLFLTGAAQEDQETDVAELELIEEEAEPTATATSTTTPTVTATITPTQQETRQSCVIATFGESVTTTCRTVPVSAPSSSPAPEPPLEAPRPSSPPVASVSAPGSSQSQIIGNRTRQPFTVERLIADVDCSQFSSWEVAQDFYEAYILAGLGNRHRLDGDGDGIACESLRAATVPHAPQSVTANAYGSSTVRVEWYDMADNEQGYRLEVLRGETTVQTRTSAPVSTRAPSMISSHISGLLPNTRYCFRVRAYNQAGTSASDYDCVTTPSR